jgi:dTDP-4-amino-4,6-dideoxygalactose transaminase
MNAPGYSQREPIMVTRATLPPLDEYVGYLEQIWSSHSLTNNGPLVRKLEDQLRDYLGSPHLWFVNNGTTALQITIKALGLQGEIITTPFSYVATTGVILWENCIPVFVDIRPGDLTIDPEQIEAAITPRTCAILATHVYGFPCDVAAIEAIARRHGLKVIYDAAHTFGCRLNGRALASYGDVSCLSFHATKVFHTVEGGAVVINGDPVLAERIRLMRAFGHRGDDHYCIGINGKNSELHAAMGLCNLPRVAATIAARRQQHERYHQIFSGSKLQFPATRASEFEYNYAYCPVLLPSAKKLLNVVQELAFRGVIARRYFHPSLNTLPYVKESTSCPVSESAASRVICLPMSQQVSDTQITAIAQTVIEACA